jgi:hypothetical protein
MTVRELTRLAIAIGIALRSPNKLPRTAGPTKPTAGAEAVRAASAEVPIGRRKAIRHNRKTTPYKPMIATDNATTKGISCLNSARGVLTAPAKSASGRA